MTQEPRFRIIGNEVKEQSGMEEPYPDKFIVDSTGYDEDCNTYEQHLASLRTYIASPELKTTFGDNEFGEKDIEVRTICNGKDCTCEEISDWYNCDYNEERKLTAYPVSQEQESWAVSEVAEFLELWDMATTMHRREFMNEAKKQYTITKNK
jgi:hypothetical protein